MANEKRLIDANALIETLSTLTVTVTGLRAGKGILNEYAKEYRKSVLRIIEEQPTAEVKKVVLCKDCIHWKNLKEYVPFCNHKYGLQGYVPQHFSCPYAERIEEE